MLLELNIQNIALIERLRIEFGRGLNVLTGETGAGKSIVVDCVNLALGGRADRDLIRTGEERACVRALFDIAGNENAVRYLNELGVDTQDGLAEVSREITRSGRNVCRVNGAMLLLSQIKTFTAFLVDLHGQHEHQALIDSERHIDFLDSFGAEEISVLKAGAQDAYQAYSDIRRQLEKLNVDESERARRFDSLSFQVKEITGAKLKEDEEEALEQKNRLYENAEKISSHLRTAYERVYIGGKSISAQESIKRALDAMRSIEDIDERYRQLAARLDEIYYTVTDVGYELQDASEETEFDPSEAEKTADRLDLIKRLKRKYGPELKDVIEFGKKAGEELKRLSRADEAREELEDSLKNEKTRLLKACEALTDARKRAAQELCQRVIGQLSDLGMGRTRFDARFEIRKTPQSDGADDVEFIISPNPGEPMKPLSSIASGGELSRIMLAIKAISAENEGVDTMIFDEIDTGISGRMAQTVGEKMCMLGKSRQVICVTHLAQIAALGDNHYLVEKTVTGEHTGSSVRKLTEEGRIGEIARLVGGADEGESGRMHAVNMLSSAQALKKRRFEA
ncbi:MAG: DNA repair protein RecN [Clostridia bacterium]|nr:DNA repair protein RecN [Clostridia bacterium]